MFTKFKKSPLLLATLLVAPLAHADSNYFSQNNAYTQSFIETHKLEAGARVEEVKLKESLNEAQSSYNRAAWELNRVNSEISSIDSSLDRLDRRERSIGGEIDDLLRGIDSVKQRASWELGLSFANRASLRRFAQDKRNEADELERRKDRLSREINDKVNYGQYKNWGDRKNDLQRERNQSARELNQKQNQLANVSKQINQHKRNIDQKQAQNENLKTKLDQQQENKKEARREVNQAQKAVDECTEKCGILKLKLKQAEAKFNAIERNIESTKNQIESNRSSIQSSREAIQNLKGLENSLPPEIRQLEREVAQLDNQIQNVSDRMATYYRNEVQPLINRRERIKDEKDDAIRKAFRADSMASEIEDKRRDIASLEREREEIPRHRENYRVSRAQLVASLPPLRSAVASAQEILDSEKAKLESFLNQQRNSWVALREARAANDKALVEAQASRPAMGSEFGLMSVASTEAVYKDWSFTQELIDSETGATICLALTTAATGEALQVLRIKDERSGIYSRPIVRILMNESDGAEGNSPITTGQFTASGLSKLTRRFEMNDTFRTRNALVVSFEDAKESISAIRRLSSVQIKASQLSGTEEAAVKFSLRGSMKTVDQLNTDCR